MLLWASSTRPKEVSCLFPALALLPIYPALAHDEYSRITDLLSVDLSASDRNMTGANGCEFVACRPEVWADALPVLGTPACLCLLLWSNASVVFFLSQQRQAPIALNLNL